MSSARLFLIQPRRNRYVLRLYNCIGTQRLASEGRKFCGPWSRLQSHASAFVSPQPLLAHKSPSSLDRAGGASEAAGRVIGLGGGELHHNDTHWRSLLI